MDDFKPINFTRKRKRNEKPKIKTPVKKLIVKGGSTKSSCSWCPICQFNFEFKNAQEIVRHIENCAGAKESAEECPDGGKCEERNIFHFKEYTHFDLALLRSCSASDSIKEEQNQENLPFRADKDVKQLNQVIKEELSSKDINDVSNPPPLNCQESDESYFCQLKGEITFYDDVVLSKSMSVKQGLPSISCDCKTNFAKGMGISGKPCNVCVKFRSEETNEDFVSQWVNKPVLLNVTYNHQGLKKINVSCPSEFEISDFELFLGNCCHISKLKCRVGRRNISEIFDEHERTAVYFDFAGLGLNCDKSVENNIAHNLFLDGIDHNVCLEGNSYLVNKNCETFEEKLALNLSEDLNSETILDHSNIEETENSKNNQWHIKVEPNSENDHCCVKVDSNSENAFFHVKVEPNSENDHCSFRVDSNSENDYCSSNVESNCENDLFPVKVESNSKNDSKEMWKNIFKKKNTTTFEPDLTFPNEPTANRKQCPFYKKIPGTSFAVDAFQYGSIPGITHYFLTHFHADHYGGLTKKFKHKILCSGVTASLVAKKLYVEPKYLSVVKCNQAFTVEDVMITPLDANHCPGSFMFLFQLKSGKCYLHVGDFRASADMQLYPVFSKINVDVLFLDTTYCNPRYEFPSQNEVVQAVIRITKRHLRLEPNTLIVSGTYTIGKEKVFIGIAEALGSNIWAPKPKLDVLKSLRNQFIDSKLVEYPCKARVHVWPMTKLNHFHLEQHLKDCSQVFKRILAFSPSGWNFKKQCALDDAPAVTRGRVTIIGVPYSEHSSYIELRDFVRFLKPSKVVPTVASRNMSFSATSKCCNKWLSEKEEEIVPDRQQKITTFLSSDE